MSRVTLLALAATTGTSPVTVYGKTVQTHVGKYVRLRPLTDNLLQKQERTSSLIGGDGEGAGTGSAGVTSVQADGFHVAVFTHLTEVTGAMVPAVLRGKKLQLMAQMSDRIKASWESL